MKTLDEYSLFKKFIKFENEKQFFKVKYKSIPIWEYSRMLIYTTLQTICKGLTPSLPTLKQSGRKQISQQINNKLIKIDSLKKGDIILMGNPRRILQEDGKYYDINTDFIPEILNEYKCLTIEDPFWSLFPNLKISHSLPVATKNILYLDEIEKIYFKKLYSSEFIEDREAIHNLLQVIINELNIEFSCRLDNAIEICVNKILYFIYAEPIFIKILQKVQPKLIMLFFHPHHSEWFMTKVAKQLKIPVVEIQHGIIGEFEPIWHKFYNQDIKNINLPDYVFAFSPAFVNKDYMPLKKKIKYVGYPFLNKKIEEHRELALNKNAYNILIISQANLSDDLSNFTAKLSELLQPHEKYHIFYKLHPYELDKEFPNLNYSNVTIVRDLKKDIYYYQSICAIQIGVYSTAIYEGTMFNTSTIIVKDLLGWQESYRLLKHLPGIYVAKSPHQALDIILSNPQKTPTNNNLWGKFSTSKYKKYIKEIIDANI